ncbi:MAG: T9SS type A sorting domain-containing protein [Bacteroidia bacterium]
MKKALFLLGTAWLFSTAAAQSPGDLDPAFSGNGYVTLNGPTPGDYISLTNVDAMADGRIVAAGRISYSFTGPYFIAARYLDNGDLDTSFAQTGTVILTDHELTGDESGMDLQADGKVLLAGAINYQNVTLNAIYRLNVDGSLDSTFGVNGLVLDSLTTESHHFFSVHAESSGRILVTSSGDDGVSVTAFQSDGQRDLSYGSGDGRVHAAFPSSQQPLLLNTFLQADGKMLTLSYADSITRYVTRVTAQGVVDSTFDGDGIQLLTYQALGASPEDITANTAGDIFLSAYFDQGNFEIVAVFKFTPSGVRDSSFGNNGVARMGEPNTDCYPYGIMIAPDGRILLTGEVYTNSGAQGIFVGRMMPNGQADSSFSSTGMSTPYLNANYHTAANIALQPDGKILSVGTYIDLQGEWTGVVCRFIYGTLLGTEAPGFPISDGTVFPNPSNGDISLKLRSEFETSLDVTVMDLTGRVVAQPYVNHPLPSGLSEFRMDLQDIPSGAYLLLTKAGSAVQSHRIVIAH